MLFPFSVSSKFNMEGNEELLSLDLEDSDYLYRIRRDDHIIYVSVCPDLIPKADRTDGSKVLARLKMVPKWNCSWRTLTVSKAPCGILSEVDRFLPHSLSKHQILGQCYNFLDLTRIRRISDRVSLVLQGNRICVLKIARFEHELESLSTEIRAYRILQLHQSTLAPRFLGCVYEEDEDRVTGFLMEVLWGYHPDSRDQQLCMHAIQELHSVGIVHGDPNKYNLLVEGTTVKFMDFEDATFWDNDDFEQLKVVEANDVITSLTDTSGLGNYGF
jgi:hypothetical protein